MYYYANIDLETGICVMVEECEEPWYDGMDDYIPLDGYYKDYEVRMKYVNGEWVESLPEETIGHSYRGEIVAVSNEWLDVALNNKADINHTHEGYAAIDHTHSEYASSDDIQTLEDMIDTKANLNHTHTSYADANHSHDEYVTQISIDELALEVDGKADESHSHNQYSLTSHEHDDYSLSNHNHNSSYATISHSHDNYVTTTNFDILEVEVSNKADSSHTHNNYAETTHNHDDSYSVLGHNHDEDYSPISHVHTDYATITSVSELSNVVSGKANNSHTHDDRYFTESEINTKLAGKADSNHNHAGVYDVSGAAASALSSANSYTDTAIDALSEAVSEKANSSTLASHAGNATIHITAAEKDKLSGIAIGANNYTLPSAGSSLGGVKTGGDVTISFGIITINDDSHNHIISNIDGLQSALDSKAVSSHNHDDVYYTENEIDILLENKASSSHTHTIANIINLQSALDGKANSSHGTHVSFSTTAPVMDGSASVGTATTVARSDHKHPVDTSRAAQTSLDALAETVSGKANTSHTHTISNITNLQSTLNEKADSGHTHSTATTSASGFMTEAMVTKLNGIAVGANAYTHPTYTARTGAPTANATPTFGGTFTVSQPVSDGSGHITAINNRTITIPSAVATSSANGLMSKSDKYKLDGMVLATVSEVETYLGI